MKLKRGFTIVELLVVVAIIGILLGLVTMAANGAIKNARGKRASAMRTVLQQAIGAYYAQVGEWPDTIGRKAENMGGRESYTFSPTETDEIFQKVVGSSVGANATMHLLDANGLFVADAGKLKNGGKGCFDNHGDDTKKSFCGNQHCIGGVDFSEAVKKGSKRRLGISSMAFGYQGEENGKFCRYWITYNARTDSVSVSTTHPDNQ